MVNPRVSIIVCTYQREETLRWIVEDILGQTFDNYELLIVDQTPEHEPQTEEFLRSQGNRLRWLRLEIANLPNARNYGVEAARGDIVVFIDDDIRLSADFIGRLLVHFDDASVDVIAPVVVDPRGHDVALAEYFRRYGHLVTTSTGSLLPAREVIGACMAIRRSVIQSLGGFDATLGALHRSATGEDFDFCQRASARGYRIFVDPSVTVLHLGFTPGGCGVRTGDPAEARRAQLRALVYMAHKEARASNRSSLWVWTHLARRCLVRRDLLRAGARGFYRRVEEMREAVKYVRGFVAGNTLLSKE